MTLFDWQEFVNSYLYNVVYCDGREKELKSMIDVNTYANLFCFTRVKFQGKSYEIPPVTYDEYIEAITSNIDYEFGNGKKEPDKYKILKQILHEMQDYVTQELYPINLSLRDMYLSNLMIGGWCQSNEVMKGETKMKYANYDLFVQLSRHKNVYSGDDTKRIIENQKSQRVNAAVQDETDEPVEQSSEEDTEQSSEEENDEVQHESVEQSSESQNNSNEVQHESIDQLSDSFSNMMSELINTHNTLKEEIKKVVKDNETLKAENKRLKDKLNRIKESINEIVDE